MKFYFFLSIIIVSASEDSSSDNDNFLELIKRHPSLDCLSDTSASDISITSSDDSSDLEISNAEYELKETFYIGNKKDLKLRFDHLIEGKNPAKCFTFNDSLFTGFVSVKIKKSSGYQNDGDCLTEETCLMLNKDDLKKLDGKKKTFTLTGTLDKSKKTNYKSVPIIFDTKNMDFKNEYIKITNSDSSDKLLFDQLIARYSVFKDDDERSKMIRNLRSSYEKCETIIDSEMETQGRRYLFFEKNPCILQKVSRHLADMLDNRTKITRKALLDYFDSKISTFYGNVLFPHNGIGDITYVNQDKNSEEHKLLTYAYLNDCMNLLKCSKDTSTTTDVYECYYKENSLTFDVVIAILFKFLGKNSIKKSHIKITSFNNEDKSNVKEADVSDFEILLFNKVLHVLIRKSVISKLKLKNIKIEFKNKSINCKTDMINLDINKKK